MPFTEPVPTPCLPAHSHLPQPSGHEVGYLVYVETGVGWCLVDKSQDCISFKV